MAVFCEHRNTYSSSHKKYISLPAEQFPLLKKARAGYYEAEYIVFKVLK
jgi:hypothetical protein